MLSMHSINHAACAKLSEHHKQTIQQAKVAAEKLQDETLAFIACVEELLSSQTDMQVNIPADIILIIREYLLSDHTIREIINGKILYPTAHDMFFYTSFGKRFDPSDEGDKRWISGKTSIIHYNGYHELVKLPSAQFKIMAHDIQKNRWINACKKICFRLSHKSTGRMVLLFTCCTLVFVIFRISYGVYIANPR